MVITNKIVNAVGTLNFSFFFGGASIVATAVAAVASADMNSSLVVFRRRACSGGFLSSISKPFLPIGLCRPRFLRARRISCVYACGFDEGFRARVRRLGAALRFCKECMP